MTIAYHYSEDTDTLEDLQCSSHYLNWKRRNKLIVFLFLFVSSVVVAYGGSYLWLRGSGVLVRQHFYFIGSYMTRYEKRVLRDVVIQDIGLARQNGLSIPGITDTNDASKLTQDGRTLKLIYGPLMRLEFVARRLPKQSHWEQKYNFAPYRWNNEYAAYLSFDPAEPTPIDQSVAMNTCGK